MLDESFQEKKFRDLAKELLPEWISWEFEGGTSQNFWGVPGLGGGISKNEDGQYIFWVNSQKKQGMGTDVPLIYGLEAIRSSAIGLLVFCEAEEWRKEK